MKRMKRILFSLCLVLLSACQATSVNYAINTPNKPAISPSLTKLEITPLSLTATKTKTVFPSETLSPSQTPTIFHPQKFDPKSIKTFTPSSPAKCPKEDPKLEFDFQKAWESNNLSYPDQNQQFTEYILNFLNSGGTQRAILTAVNKFYKKHFDAKDNPLFTVQDVTGDHIPELIFPYGIWLDIFGCKATQYQLLASKTYESDLAGVGIYAITDVNRDGLAEIIARFEGCFGGRCPTIKIYEWNGNEFNDLLTNSCSQLSEIDEIKIQDIDKNGTQEIVITNNGKLFPDGIYGFPYRKRIQICMWNGEKIVTYKTEFGAPYYRFQAVQDGDNATLAGEYGKALNFYQQAISSKKLEWFTQERNISEFWVYHAQYFPSAQEPIPTASPSMVPDPNEYPNLAAYAQYRIMLLYILQNDLSNAEKALDILRKDYPSDQLGGYFADIASTFWQKYQTTKNIKQACSDAIGMITSKSELLAYIGDSDHGTQAIDYTPEAICPFK